MNRRHLHKTLEVGVSQRQTGVMKGLLSRSTDSYCAAEKLGESMQQGYLKFELTYYRNRFRQEGRSHAETQSRRLRSLLRDTEGNKRRSYLVIRWTGAAGVASHLSARIHHNDV